MIAKRQRLNIEESRVTLSKDGKPEINYVTQLVTPKMAMSMLEDMYTEQRPLRQHHVSYLRTLMRLRAFRCPTEIHFAELDGQRYLVNGQHVVTALSEHDAPQWLTICTIYISSYVEVGALYATFDRGLQRNWRDMYRALPQGKETRLQKTELGLVGAAVPLIALGGMMLLPGESYRSAPFVETLRTASVRLALIQSWEGEAEHFFGNLYGSKSIVRLLHRASIVAIALLTYRWQPEKASLFWEKVSRDNGLIDGDPAKALLRFVMDKPANRFRPDVYLRYVASCWNAYYSGREYNQVRTRAGNLPLYLMGTPHDGAHHYLYVTRHGDILQRPERFESSVAMTEDT